MKLLIFGLITLSTIASAKIYENRYCGTLEVKSTASCGACSKYLLHTNKLKNWKLHILPMNKDLLLHLKNLSGEFEGVCVYGDESADHNGKSMNHSYFKADYIDTMVE